MPAIPFITVDEQTGAYSLHPDAVAFLSSLNDEPLVIAAVAGKYRTGKSSLLNRALLGVSGNEGFGVGGSINAHTKGLWLNTNMLGVDRPLSENEKGGAGGGVNLLVIDTEGLGALTATDTHDTRIFALALLVSSYFIYNSVGTIDESTINTLSLVANISKHVRVRSDEGASRKMPVDGEDDANADSDEEEERAKELGNHFPHFLWVVRDFTLKMVNERGKPITESQYLEQALGDMPVPDKADKKQIDLIAEKNRLRTLLRAYFPHRDCATLVRPVATEEELQRLDSLPDSQLRPEFLKQAKRLRNKVLREAPIKTAMGGKRPVSGRMLVRLCQAYVDALNAGAAPVIRDSWALLADAQFRDAIDRAERAFQAEMPQHILNGNPIDPEAVERVCDRSRRAAVLLFQKDAPEQDGPAHADFLAKLHHRLDEVVERFAANNERLVETLAQRIVESVERSELKSALRAESSSGDKASEEAFRSSPWDTICDAIQNRYENDFARPLLALSTGATLSADANDVWARVWHSRLLAWPRQLCVHIESRYALLLQRTQAQDRQLALAQEQTLHAQRIAADLEAQAQKDEAKKQQFRTDLEAEFETLLQQSRDALAQCRIERDNAQDALALCQTEAIAKVVEETDDVASVLVDDKTKEIFTAEQIESLPVVCELRLLVARYESQAAIERDENAAQLDELRLSSARATAEKQQLRKELDDAAEEFSEQLARIQDETTRTMSELRRARLDDAAQKDEEVRRLASQLQVAQRVAKEANEATAENERRFTSEKERLEQEVRTLADQAEKRDAKYEEQERAMKKSFRDQAERYEKALQQAHDDQRAETRRRAEEALAERQSLTQKCLEADRKATRLEEQRAALQKRIDEYGDIGAFRKTQIEAEKTQALLERSDNETKALRAAALEARQRSDESAARIVALEKQLKDQERQFEVAKLRLKMDYEIESARLRSTAGTASSAHSLPGVSASTTAAASGGLFASSSTFTANAEDGLVKRRRI
jgi:hypothetical protein